MELELVKTEANSTAAFNQSAEYTKLNPTGKIPAFEGANGFVLSEAIALAVYGTLYNKRSSLLSILLLLLAFHMMNVLLYSSYPCQNYTVDNLKL